MAVKIKQQKVPLEVQRIALLKAFPAAVGRILSSELSWKGSLQPSACSRDYQVRMKYKLGDVPKVHVLAPSLEAPEGKSLPHVYKNQRNRLCLYRYLDEWNPGMLIADTIIPWTSEWLLHYEFWRLTGTWSGGGHEGNKP